MSSNIDRNAVKKDANAATDAGYHTYPITTTHGPKDKSSYHGKPEDWKRVGVKRTFATKQPSS